MGNSSQTSNSPSNQTLAHAVPNCFSIEKALCSPKNLSLLLKNSDLSIEDALLEFAKNLCAPSDFPGLTSALNTLQSNLKQHPADSVKPSVNLSATVNCSTTCFAKLEVIEATSLNASSLLTTNSDYVALDASCTKVWDFTETITVPIGNGKVKMKTSDFIALVGILITLFISTVTFVSDRLDSGSSTQVTEQSLKLEQERNLFIQEKNELLYDLINCVDTSVSSHSQEIEDLKETIQSLKDTLQELNLSAPSEDSLSQVQSEDHDDCPMIPDNMSEYSHTESENE